MKKIKVFTAPWCMPCKQLKEKTLPLLMEEGVEIEVIDLEESPDLAAEYKVRGVPTMLYDGHSLVGFKTVEEVRKAFFDG